MIAISDSTVLAVIRIDVRIGRSTEIARGTPGVACCTRDPSIRPNRMKIKTGTPIEPMTPSGSRRKILISSQVSFQSPRSMVSACLSVPNHVAGQFQKYILERRQLGAEVDDADPVLRQTLDDPGDE